MVCPRAPCNKLLIFFKKKELLKEAVVEAPRMPTICLLGKICNNSYLFQTLDLGLRTRGCRSDSQDWWELKHKWILSFQLKRFPQSQFNSDCVLSELAIGERP